MLNTITIIFYVLGALAQTFQSLRKRHYKFSPLFVFGIPAVFIHAYLLHNWIDQNTGQNLTEFNLLSLAIWLTACITILLAAIRQVSYLAILIFPLASASNILVETFPSSHIIQTSADPKQIFHILLSVATFSVLCIAGLQAVTLAVQEKFLKQKYFQVSKILPPIESMEKLLFQIISVGAILLSIVLVSSIYFFHSIMLQFLQKTVLTFIAWFVFIVLLIGRYYFGWRGRKAIYCTLSGVGILSIIYFGSMLIMEFLP